MIKRGAVPVIIDFGRLVAKISDPKKEVTRIRESSNARKSGTDGD